MGCTSSRPSPDATTTFRAARPTSTDRTHARTSTTSAPHSSALPTQSHLTTTTTTTTTTRAPPTDPTTTTSSVPTTTSTRTHRLKPPRPWLSSTSPPPINPLNLPATQWTTTLLHSERAAFFDTRVTNSPAIWQAIALAVSLGRDSGDWKGAQSVLEAAGCTVQRGRLEEGVWDERGQLYQVPRWVVSDPGDVVDDTSNGLDERERLGNGEDEGTDGEEEEEEEEEDDDGDVDAEKRHDPDTGSLSDEKTIVLSDGSALAGDSKEELTTSKSLGKHKGKGKGKGKGKVMTEAAQPPKDPVKIKARLSDRGSDAVVVVDREDAVKVVVKRLCGEADIPSSTKIKLCYMGKMLSPDLSLPAQGWQVGHVVQALVFR